MGNPNPDPAPPPNPQQCRTSRDAGKKRDRRCVFPFRLNGIEYTACTNDGGGDDKRPWCSTETNDGGKHQKGQWGYCSGNCPGMAGDRAILTPTSTAKEDGEGSSSSS